MCCSVFCSQALEKLVQKTDILFFVGRKEKTGREKILCLQAAKIFFGSAIQLCFQIWILQVAHYNGKFERISQYLSIIMSFLLITKNSVGLISYSRSKFEKENTDEGKLRTISLYLSWLPVIITSLLFKIGLINQLVIFFGWYSMVIIFGIYILNISSSFIIDCVMEKYNRLLIVYKDEYMLNGAQKTLEKFLISFSNIFVFSRPVNTLR